MSVSLPEYAATNIAAASFTSAVGGFDATYGSANLQDSRQAVVCKSAASVTTWKIVADMGGATTLNTVALCNHNLPTGVGSTLLLEGSATGAFGGEQTTVVGPTTDVAIQSAALTFTAVAFRYWRLTITTVAGLVMQIGELWLCNATVLNRQFVWPPKRKEITKTSRQESTGGLLTSYRFMASKREFHLRWNDVKEVDREQLRGLIKNVTAVLLLFVLMAQNSNPTTAADQECVLGMIWVDEAEADQEFYDINNGFILVIREDGLGTGQ